MLSLVDIVVLVSELALVAVSLVLVVVAGKLVPVVVGGWDVLTDVLVVDVVVGGTPEGSFAW
ncbi:hypothetical protein RAM_28885 [Amycolatopsis mediterranei S699]|uniref:Uncharacterized protein n=1 Tax=Amycolatopsis mediterranei (strain S699) TaxID=713604 RepID=A0A9R0P125_AMYMS|nr:hypothetical protein RAM_28885 [Amycolatopsis mediterranei S699]